MNLKPTCVLGFLNQLVSYARGQVATAQFQYWPDLINVIRTWKETEVMSVKKERKIEGSGEDKGWRYDWLKALGRVTGNVKTPAPGSLQPIILSHSVKFYSGANTEDRGCGEVTHKVWFHFLSQVSPLSFSLCPNYSILPLFISRFIFPNTLFLPPPTHP